MESRPNGITRRGLMGAMGGALAGGALVGGDLVSATAEPVDVAGVPLSANSGKDGVVSPSSVPVVTAGLSYVVYTQYDFRAVSHSYSGYQGSGFYSGNGWFIATGLNLAAGTRIREITAWCANASGSSAYLYVQRASLDGVGGLANSAYLTIASPNTVATPQSTTCDLTLEPGYCYSLAMLCSDNSVGVSNVRIGYDNTGSYVPVSPYRCYDSRFTLSGRVAPSTGRVIDVTQAINTSTGVVAATDVIPPDARAVTFNMQAVGATGANNFAITNGNAVSANSSHIVFNTNTPTVANGGTVDLWNGQVKIHGGAGPGSAHCIIDITGYYV